MGKKQLEVRVRARPWEPRGGASRAQGSEHAGASAQVPLQTEARGTCWHAPHLQGSAATQHPACLLSLERYGTGGKDLPFSPALRGSEQAGH